MAETPNACAKAAVEPEYVSVAEAAVRVSLGEDFIYDSVASGDLPAVRKGRRVLVKLADLRAWMERDRGRGVALSRPELAELATRYSLGASR